VSERDIIVIAPVLGMRGLLYLMEWHSSVLT